jgi:hypothetical protein
MTALRKTLRAAVRIALAILPWLTILSALVLQPD